MEEDVRMDIPIEPIPDYPSAASALPHESAEAAPRWTVVSEVNREGKERFYIALWPLRAVSVRLWLDRRGRPTTIWGRKRYRSRERAERIRTRFMHRYSRHDWRE